MNEKFVELSAELTGFSGVELLGTGMAEQYLAVLLKHAGRETTEALLDAWEEIQGSPRPWDTAFRNGIFGNARLGDAARKLIKLWYLGQWEEAGNKTFIVSSEAYQQGLVWEAINAHPPGAKQPGFGTWSFPPSALEKRS